MTLFVALFRGINLGRTKRVAMADLRKLLESLGYRDVRTLLNSGNAVFDGASDLPAKHAKRIREAVASELGVDAHVVIKSAKDIAAAVAGNPLKGQVDDPSRLLVALTNDPKALAKLASLGKEEWAPEKVHVGKHAAYVWCANGILESKATAALMKGLAGTGTTRNWSTIGKIHAMLQNTA